jgi:tetratricopeptide (TPR) repeat protein
MSANWLEKLSAMALGFQKLIPRRKNLQPCTGGRLCPPLFANHQACEKGRPQRVARTRHSNSLVSPGLFLALYRIILGLVLGFTLLPVPGAMLAAHAQTASRKSQVLAPPKTGLLAIDEPDLESLEAAIREQLIDLRNQLSAIARERSIDDGKLSEVYGSMGQVYQAYSLAIPAEQCYVNAHRLAANEFRWPYLLGQLCQQQARLEEALRYYTRARQLRPDYLAVLVHLGNLYLQQNQWPEAAASFQQALAINPRCAAAHYGLGQMALSGRKFAEAVSRFEQALAEAPEATRLHYALAMAYRGLGNLERAQAHLQQQGKVGVRVFDPVTDALQELVRGERLPLLRGRLAFAARRYAEAVAEFRKALAVNPESLAARVNLGSALAQSGSVKEAIDEFQKALKLDAKNASALFNLGVLLAQENHHLEAIQHLQALTQVNPKDAEAHYLLGREWLKAQRPEEALTAFASTVELNADNEDALLEMVNLLAQKKAYKEAVQGLEKGHARYPDKGRTAITLAYFLASIPPYGLRDGKKALELAARVYQATGAINHGAIVAQALAELGRCAEAAEWQRKLIAQAEGEGNATLSAKLKADLPRYEKSSPCRLAGETVLANPRPLNETKKP